MGNGYKDLRVWKEAMQLAKEVYVVSSSFPKEELYGLTQQVRRSAVSVASNIAEGSGRNNAGEFYQFIGIALGSLAELKTQLMIAESVFYALSEQVAPLLSRAEEVSKMLHGLKKNINDKRKTNNE